MFTPDENISVTSYAIILNVITQTMYVFVAYYNSNQNRPNILTRVSEQLTKSCIREVMSTESSRSWWQWHTAMLLRRLCVIVEHSHVFFSYRNQSETKYWGVQRLLCPLHIKYWGGTCPPIPGGVDAYAWAWNLMKYNPSKDALKITQPGFKWERRRCLRIW
jgi:hypothetical protein